MIYTITINDKTYEVEVERGQANILKTMPAAPAAAPTPAPAAPTPAPAAPAAAPTPAAAPAPAAGAAPAAAGEIIEAPMPGMVLDIKVTPGQAVQKGDVLVIMEAMKMENEIMAPRAGVVSQIFVTKGATVTTSDPLLSLQ